MQSEVKKYLLQDLNEEEKKSYLNYKNGDLKSVKWIPKASIRREAILNMKCDFPYQDGLCNKWINVYENGKCSCSRGHLCYEQILEAIKKSNL